MARATKTETTVDPAVKVAQVRGKMLAALGTPVAQAQEGAVAAASTIAELRRNIGEQVWVGYVAIREAMGEATPTPADWFVKDDKGRGIWSDIVAAYSFDVKPGAPKVTMGKVRRGVSTLSGDFDLFRCWSHHAAAVAAFPDADDAVPMSDLLPKMRELAGCGKSNRTATESTNSALSGLGAALTDAGCTLDEAKQASADDAKIRVKAWEALGPWADMLSTFSAKVADSKESELRAIARLFTAAADAKKAPKVTEQVDDGSDAAQVAEQVADTPSAPAPDASSDLLAVIAALAAKVDALSAK